MAFTPIAFASLLSGAAGVVCFTTARMLLRAKHSASWPTVDGTIITAEVVTASKGERPKIVYRYRVADRQYESDRIMVGGMWGTSGNSSTQMIQRFPKGATAAVAVDPNRPAYSVLVPGVRVHQIFSAVIGVLVLLATVPILLAFVRVGTP